MFTLGPFGETREKRHLPECQLFVPLVRRQTKTAPLHLSVPLQLIGLTKRYDSMPEHTIVFLRLTSYLLVLVKPAFPRV